MPWSTRQEDVALVDGCGVGGLLCTRPSPQALWKSRPNTSTTAEMQVPTSDAAHTKHQQALYSKVKATAIAHMPGITCTTRRVRLLLRQLSGRRRGPPAQRASPTVITPPARTRQVHVVENQAPAGEGGILPGRPCMLLSVPQHTMQTADWLRARLRSDNKTHCTTLHSLLPRQLPHGGRSFGAV